MSDSIVTVAVSRQFLAWIMSLDGEIKIVSPEPVVQEMKEIISELTERYSL